MNSINLHNKHVDDERPSILYYNNRETEKLNDQIDLFLTQIDLDVKRWKHAVHLQLMIGLYWW